MSPMRELDKHITVRVSATLRERLVKLGKRGEYGNRKSVSQMIRKALAAGLDAMEKSRV